MTALIDDGFTPKDDGGWAKRKQTMEMNCDAHFEALVRSLYVALPGGARAGANAILGLIRAELALDHFLSQPPLFDPNRIIGTVQVKGVDNDSTD